MEMKKNVLTYEGLKKYEDELHELKVHKRQEVAQRLKEAREQGDITENSEYDAARDEQRDIEVRIEALENILKNAEVVLEEDIDTDRISVGCKVKIRDLEYKEDLEYKIVGSSEANSLKGKLSNESPVGKALIGAKKGQTVSVETQAGIIKYKVLEIDKASSFLMAARCALGKICKVERKEMFGKLRVVKTALVCILASITLLTGCGNSRPNKKDAQEYLDMHLDEPYQMVSETHDDKEDTYKLYLPDSDITVHFTCKYEYNSAIHQIWKLNIYDYYETKYLSLSDERRKLREEKYPVIREEVTFRSYLGDSVERIDTVNISIDSKDDLERLYDYLIECYRLNDFKYYNAYSMVDNKLTSLYWQDYIGVKLFCSDKQIMFLYFSDLRKEECCLPEGLSKMITYDEFVGKIWK